ncbi:nuclear transport factor 2 family protein [Pseudonocardia acaciae]|uniref:nuclear transport factor 2 family protein n=1 Tax=Pseudonocardia acaciae TaxID=551276 RepID=UPI0006870824|nr:nuclear transport factor 2 family protein [Pseudonocardia acaciae]
MTQVDAARAWVEAFAEGWRAPAGADAFADHFEPLFTPDCRLIQPLSTPMVGHRGLRERFARPLFALVSDLHGTVEGWASRGEVIYIEVRLDGRIGHRAVTFRSCDRVTLRDGLAVERFAYPDLTPLLWTAARTPRAWPHTWRLLSSARS